MAADKYIPRFEWETSDAMAGIHRIPIPAQQIGLPTPGWEFLEILGVKHEKG